MTRARWTPADISLAEQAIAAGQPANVIAAGSAYATKKAEQQEQMWFVEWCQAQTVELEDADGDAFMIRLDAALVGYPGGAFLSGNKKRRGMQWSILKKMACKAGVSDLTLFVPFGGYHGLCMEMKKRRDQFKCSSDIARAISNDQTAHLQLMRRLGYRTGVPFGWVEAAQLTCSYLSWDHAEHGIERPLNGR